MRALLAGARHDGPTPDHVAARLDRVLAQLQQDRETEPPLDLHARRRRKNAGRLLLAAAAIVIGGVGVGQLIGTGGQDAGDADSAGGDAALRTTQSPDQDPQELGAAGAESAGEPAPNADAVPTDLAGKLPVTLSPGSFDRDVRRLASGSRALDSAASAQEDLVESTPAFHCPPAAYGKGTLIPAYYDDEPTVLAFRPPLGGRQVAELLRCGTAERLRSLTLTRADRR